MVETEIETTPIAAYELEEQMLAVEETQRRGGLDSGTHTYRGRKTVKELGVRWHIFRATEVNSVVFNLAAYDCDEKLLKRLRIGETIREIRVPGNRPDILFGRDEHIVAAILNSKGQPVYKSPGFDLDAYLSVNV